MLDAKWNARVQAATEAFHAVTGAECVLVIAIKSLDNPKDCEATVAGFGNSQSAQRMIPRMIHELGAYMSMTRSGTNRGFQEN